LIVAALRLGGIYAEASAADQEILIGVGEGVGLSFQIADDILDVEGSTEALGKTAGKDARADKLTYPGVFGLEESKRRLEDVKDRTIDLAQRLPHRGGALPALVEWLARRDH
jgi:geranylgeranyl pyrophosphate synthase